MKLSKKTKQYWWENDWKDLENAKSVADLHAIAERIISRMNKPLIQVCGPIGTGGLGSVEKNLNVFNDTIIKLQEKGFDIFDQMPFEDQMQNMKKKFSSDQVVENILNHFYLPIFKSGAISTFYFMPGWQTSIGANWEHEEAQKLGIKIVYL
jgi:hypothetical protein